MRSVAAFILNRTLSQFIEPVTSNQIVTKILSGEASISQIAVKKTALSAVGIPIKVSKGTINNVHAKIPFMKLSTSPTVITVDGLYILGRFSDRAWLDSDLVTNFSSYTELDKIADEQKTSKSNVKMNYMTSVAQNLAVRLRNIHIRLEMEIEGVVRAGGIICKTFEINSPEGEEKDYKETTLSGFSIYLDTTPTPPTGRSFEEQMFQSMTSDKHQYILKDFNFVTRLIIPKMKQTDPILLLLSVGEVKTMFDASQWQCLNAARTIYNRLCLKAFGYAVGRPRVAFLQKDNDPRVNQWWGYTYRIIRRKKYPREFVVSDALEFFAAKRELYQDGGVMKYLPFFGKKDKTFVERKQIYGVKIAKMLRCYDFAKAEINEIHEKRKAVDDLDTSAVSLSDIDFDNILKRMDIDIARLEAVLQVDSEKKLTRMVFGRVTGEFSTRNNIMKLENFRISSFEVTNEVSPTGINLVSMWTTDGTPCFSFDYMMDRINKIRSLNCHAVAPLVFADMDLILQMRKFFTGSATTVTLPEEKSRDHLSSEIAKILEEHCELSLQVSIDAPVITIPCEDNLNVVLGRFDIRSIAQPRRNPRDLNSLYDAFTVTIDGFSVMMNGEYLCQPVTTEVSLHHRFVVLNSIPEFKMTTRVGAIDLNLNREQFIKLCQLKLRSTRRDGEVPQVSPTGNHIQLASDERDVSFSMELTSDNVSVTWRGEDATFVSDNFVINGMHFSVSGIGNRVDVVTEVGSMKALSSTKDGNNLELFKFGSSENGKSFVCNVSSIAGVADFLDVRVKLGAFWLNCDVPWIAHIVKDLLPPEDPHPHDVFEQVQSTQNQVPTTVRTRRIATRRLEAIKRQLRDHVHLKLSLECEETRLILPCEQGVAVTWESISIRTPQEIPRSIDNVESFYDVFEFDWKKLTLEMGTEQVITPIDTHLDLKVLFVKEIEMEMVSSCLSISSLECSLTERQCKDLIALIDMMKSKVPSFSSTKEKRQKEDTKPNSFSFRANVGHLRLALVREDHTPINEFEVKAIQDSGVFALAVDVARISRESRSLNLYVSIGDVLTRSDFNWLMELAAKMPRPKRTLDTDEQQQNQAAEKLEFDRFSAKINSVELRINHGNNEISFDLRNVDAVPGVKLTQTKSKISLSAGSFHTRIDTDIACDLINALITSGIFYQLTHAEKNQKQQTEEKTTRQTIHVSLARSNLEVVIDKETLRDHLLFEFEVDAQISQESLQVAVPCFNGYFVSGKESKRRAFLDGLSFSYGSSQEEDLRKVNFSSRTPFRVNITSSDLAFATKLVRNSIPKLKKSLLIDWSAYENSTNEERETKKQTRYQIELSEMDLLVFENNNGTTPIIRCGVDSVVIPLMEKEGIETGIPIRLKALEVFNFSTGMFDMFIEPVTVALCLKIEERRRAIKVDTADIYVNVSISGLYEVRRFFDDVILRIKENDTTQVTTPMFEIVNKTGYDTELSIDGTRYSFKSMESVSSPTFNNDSQIQFILDHAETIRPRELIFPACIATNIFAFQTQTHNSRTIIFSSSLSVSNNSNLDLLLISKEKKECRTLVRIEPWKEQAVPHTEQCTGALGIVEVGQPLKCPDDCLFMLRRDTMDVITKPVRTSIGLIPFTIRIKRRQDSPVYEIRISPVVVIQNRLPCKLSLYLPNKQKLSVESGSQVSTYAIKSSEKTVRVGIRLDETSENVEFVSLPLNGKAMVPVVVDSFDTFVTWSARKSSNRVQITIFAPAILYNMTGMSLMCGSDERNQYSSLTEKGLIWGTKDYLAEKRSIIAKIALKTEGSQSFGCSFDCCGVREGMLMVAKNPVLAVPLTYVVKSAEPFAESYVVTFFNCLEVENRLSFPIRLRPRPRSGHVKDVGFLNLEPGKSSIIKEATPDLLFEFHISVSSGSVPLSLASLTRTTFMSPNGDLIQLRVKEKGRLRKAFFSPAVLPQPLLISNRLDDSSVTFLQSNAALKLPRTVEPNTTAVFAATDPTVEPILELTIGSLRVSVPFTHKIGDLKVFHSRGKPDIYAIIALCANGARSLVIFSDAKLTAEYYPPVTKMNFSFTLPRLCVSLVNETPRELALVVLHRVSLSASGQDSLIGVGFQVEKLTVEDMHPNAVYKIAVLGSAEKSNFLEINGTMFQKVRALTVFRDLSISIRTIKVFAHTPFLSDMYAFWMSAIPGIAAQKLEPPAASRTRPKIAKIPLSVEHLTISPIEVKAVILGEPRVRFYSRMLPALAGVPSMSDPISVSLDEIQERHLQVTYGYLGKLSKTIIDRVKSQMSDVYWQALRSIVSSVIKKRTDQTREEMSTIREQKAFVNRQIGVYDPELAALQRVVSVNRPIECVQCVYHGKVSTKVLVLTQSFIIEGDTAQHKAFSCCVTSLTHRPTHTGVSVLMQLQGGTRTFECESEAQAIDLVRQLTTRAIITLKLEGARI